MSRTRFDCDNLGSPVEKEPEFLSQNVAADLGLFLDEFLRVSGVLV